MLGTVQLGLNYGIANRTGQPSYETARDIIRCAYDGGINCFDTAAGYGVSEEVLGRALAELGIKDKVAVVSKVVHMADDLSPDAAYGIIEESVTQSLKRLRLDSLHACLFHREDNFPRYAEALAKLRDKGLVRHIGSSAVTPECALDIARSGMAEALQVPVSMMDQRYIRQGVCAEARNRGIAVFARSVYLQGLLLMPEEDIAPELAAAASVRRELKTIADEVGIGIAELAMRYVLSLEDVTCIVVGVETAQQMRENIRLFAKGPLDESLATAISDSIPDLPVTVLDPRNWSMRMPDAKLASKRSG